MTLTTGRSGGCLRLHLVQSQSRSTKHEQNGGDYPQNVQGKSEPAKITTSTKGQKNEHDISISFLVASDYPQSGSRKPSGSAVARHPS